MIARVMIIVMLLWAGSANAQETDADAQSLFTCPQSAECEGPDDLFVWAGDEPEPPEDPEVRGEPKARLGDRGRRLEQLRMRKMQEFLQLSPEQREKLMPLLRESRRELRQIEGERRLVIDDMAEEVKSNRPNEDRLGQLISKLGDLDQKRVDLKRKFFDQAKNVLEPVQMAKLVIFESRFEEELLERVRGMREHPGMPKGPRGGSGRGMNPDRR